VNNTIAVMNKLALYLPIDDA